MNALHQAISAEVSNPGGVWPITRAAAYRNMDFTSAAGGAPAGGANNTMAGSSGESEAGDTSVGGSQSAGGSSHGSAGSSAAGMNTAQSDAGDSAAGATTTATGGDKGHNCGCRVVRSNSSKLADLAALVALGIALRRRRSRAARTKP